MATPGKDGKVVVTEIKGDLFSCPETSSMAHCVSADLHMGRGIATAFKKTFGRVEELKAQGVRPGGVATINVGNRYVYYLVTKDRYFHKPTYDMLASSVRAMRSHTAQHNIKELAMPRIGCGLDRLEWPKVKGIIKREFADTQINISVYYL